MDNSTDQKKSEFTHTYHYKEWVSPEACCAVFASWVKCLQTLWQQHCGFPKHFSSPFKQIRKQNCRNPQELGVLLKIIVLFGCFLSWLFSFSICWKTTKAMAVFKYFNAEPNIMASKHHKKGVWVSYWAIVRKTLHIHITQHSSNTLE